MVFPVVMYGCESCTIKKAEGQRIDAFELWSWKRLFNSSSFSSIRVFSFRYLRWLIFFLAILIPACDSSSPAFHKMYSARKSKQSILKETSPEYSLKGLMLKLKLQYFGHLMQRSDSFEKTLMLGGIGGERRRR